MSTTRKVLELEDYNAADPDRPVIKSLVENKGKFDLSDTGKLTDSVADSLATQFAKQRILINGKGPDLQSLLVAIRNNRNKSEAENATQKQDNTNKSEAEKATQKEVNKNLNLNEAEYAALNSFIQNNFFSTNGFLQKLKELILGASLGMAVRADGKFMMLNLTKESDQLFLDVEISDVAIMKRSLAVKNPKKQMLASPLKVSQDDLAEDEFKQHTYKSTGVITARCQLNLVEKKGKEIAGVRDVNASKILVEPVFVSATPSTSLLRILSLHSKNLDDWVKIENLKKLCDEAINYYQKSISQLESAKIAARLNKRIKTSGTAYQFNAKENPVKVSKNEPAPTNADYSESVEIAKQKMKAAQDLRDTLNDVNPEVNLKKFKERHLEVSKRTFEPKTPRVLGESETFIMQKRRDSIWSTFLNRIKMILGYKLGTTESAHFMQSTELIFNHDNKNKAVKQKDISNPNSLKHK